MKKTFLLFAVLVFISFPLFAFPNTYPSSRTDAPFGLEWGMSISEAYDKCIRMDLEIGDNLTNIKVIPPNPLYIFNDYEIEFGEMGLYYIHASFIINGMSKYYGTGRDYLDCLNIAKKYADKSSYPYSGIIALFGEPDRVEESYDPIGYNLGFYHAQWINDYIVLDYSIYISDYSDARGCDQQVEVSMGYLLRSKRFGVSQTVLMH